MKDVFLIPDRKSKGGSLVEEVGRKEKRRIRQYRGKWDRPRLQQARGMN